MSTSAEWAPSSPSEYLDSLTFKPVVRLSRDATILDVARQLRATDVSSVLLGSEIRTIVTERDIVQAIADGIDPAAPAISIASRIPLWITTTSTFADAADMMQHREVRHLIVIEPNGHEVGVLSIRDVLAVLKGHLDQR